MRNSVAAIALIQQEENNQTTWLSRWNPTWNGFSFVSGQQSNGESFRDCLIRELTEELGLEPDADFLVAQKPHSNWEYTAFADGTRVKTAFTMELYDVELTGDFSHDKIASDTDNRWLLPAEIQAAATTDGHPVSGTMALLLGMAGLLNTDSSNGKT